MKLKLALLSFVTSMICMPLHAQAVDTSPSPEQGVRQEWHGKHKRFWEKLNLTEQQKAQIKGFRADNKASMRAAMLNFLTAQKALQDAISNKPNDEATISSLAASVSSARTQLTIQRAKFQAQVAGILNPEQRQTLDEMHKKRLDWLQKRIDRLSQQS
jgi:Spy/CpxP family protein refolding chaperone